MSFLFTLLILLGVWFFIIAPFIRLIQVSRQWKDLFSGTQAQKNQTNPQTHTQQKKKIDPTVGEYVEFTETTTTKKTTTAADGHQSTSQTTESQITDVTWEDI